MSRGTAIVDAAVTNLNSGSYTLSFTAAKALFPIKNLNSITGTIVQVLQGNASSERVTRTNHFIDTYDVIVVIAGPIANDDNSTLEPFYDTTEEIQDRLRTAQLTALGTVYYCQEVDVVPPFGEDMIASSGFYHNVLTFKFKG